MRVYQPPCERLPVAAGFGIRLEKGCAAEYIPLHGGIFLRRQQFFCKIILKNGMFLVFGMKRPAERAHKRGDTAFVFHKVSLHAFLLFRFGIGVTEAAISTASLASARFSISRI